MLKEHRATTQHQSPETYPRHGVPTVYLRVPTLTGPPVSVGFARDWYGDEITTLLAYQFVDAEAAARAQPQVAETWDLEQGTTLDGALLRRMDIRSIHDIRVERLAPSTRH